MGFWSNLRQIFSRRQKQDKKIEIKTQPKIMPIEAEKPKTTSYTQPKIEPLKEIKPPSKPKIQKLKKKYKKTSEIEKHIKQEGKYDYELYIQESTGFVSDNGNDYMSEYGKMLKQKVNDKEIFQELVNNRENIIRRRGTAIVTLWDNNNNSAQLKVNGALPEDLATMQEYFIGEEVASNTFNEMVDNLKNRLNNQGKGVLSTSVIRNVQGYWKVTKLTMKGDFK